MRAVAVFVVALAIAGCAPNLPVARGMDTFHTARSAKPPQAFSACVVERLSVSQPVTASPLPDGWLMRVVNLEVIQFDATARPDGAGSLVRYRFIEDPWGPKMFSKAIAACV